MTADLYQRSDKALFSSVGDDIVALHVDKGHCYGLEKVASDVWRLLEKPIALNSICEALIARYEVDPSTCRGEVGRLIDQLVREGLVEVSSAA